MTSIIIGLLAALGIGGGIALSSHGGGGGGDGDSGYTEPAQPGKKPSIISLLAAADKYQHIQSVSNYEGAPSIGDGIFTVTGEKPVVESSKFKTDESDGEIEDIYEPYTTTIGLDNYSHSDAYADYYQKDSFATKGLYNEKEYPDDPDKWVEVEVTTKDMLALGGQVLGLKNSEFGYHNNITASSYGELPDYKTFYMYDDTKQASTARTDTASYKGNILGYAEAENSHLQETLGEDIQPLTGNINLNIDFANNILNGNIDTKLSNKNWYSFNVSGNLHSVSDFSLGSISIDESRTPDSSLSKYNMTNVYGYGNGKLLEGDKQNELVGQVDLHGENSNYYVNADMSFGAIDNNIYWGNSSEDDHIHSDSNGIISQLLDETLHSNVKTALFPNCYRWFRLYNGAASSLVETKQSSISLHSQNLVISTGRPVVEKIEKYFQGDRFLERESQLYFSSSDKINSLDSRYELYRKISNTTGLYNLGSSSNPSYVVATIQDTTSLVLGGGALSLENGDFGFWTEKRSGSPDGKNNFYYSSPFYLWDQDKIYWSGRNDNASFSGNVLFPKIDPAGVGSIDMQVNFAENSLTGSVVSNWYNFPFSGTLSPGRFNFKDLNNLNINGSGQILKGTDGMELVGSFYDYSARDTMVFGLKEVK